MTQDPQPDFNAPFDIVFDFKDYCTRRKGEIPPRKAFPIRFDDPSNESLVREALMKQAVGITREAGGSFPYPYLVPGGPYDTLWDWDAFFAGSGIADKYGEYYEGSLLNFLHYIQPGGRPAHMISPNGPQYEYVAIPIQAQWCVTICRMKDDFEWVRAWWDKLNSLIEWYQQLTGSRHGLFRMTENQIHGVDNDPVTYGRRGDTVAAVNLNTFHYREYRAMALLAEKLGDSEAREEYRSRADALQSAINRYMWDPIDGMYYHLDLSDHVKQGKQQITWELHYKLKTWSCLFPLWAGIPTQSQARRVIEEHVLNPEEFLSDFGLRSTARNERVYNNEPMGGPSNWQGGIWGIATFLTAYGLARYGYRKEAADLANRLIAVYAGDIRTNSVTHEYYHAETGAPVIKPGFLSWNLMAVNIPDNLRKGVDPMEIP